MSFYFMTMEEENRRFKEMHDNVNDNFNKLDRSTKDSFIWLVCVASMGCLSLICSLIPSGVFGMISFDKQLILISTISLTYISAMFLVFSLIHGLILMKRNDRLIDKMDKQVESDYIDTFGRPYVFHG